MAGDPSTNENHQRHTNALATSSISVVPARSFKRPVILGSPRVAKRSRISNTAPRCRKRKEDASQASAVASVARMRLLRTRDAEGSSPQASSSAGPCDPIHDPG